MKCVLELQTLRSYKYPYFRIVIFVLFNRNFSELNKAKISIKKWWCWKIWRFDSSAVPYFYKVVKMAETNKWSSLQLKINELWYFFYTITSWLYRCIILVVEISTFNWLKYFIESKALQMKRLCWDYRVEIISLMSSVDKVCFFFHLFSFSVFYT